MIYHIIHFVNNEYQGLKKKVFLFSNEIENSFFVCTQISLKPTRPIGVKT